MYQGVWNSLHHTSILYIIIALRVSVIERACKDCGFQDILMLANRTSLVLFALLPTLLTWTDTPQGLARRIYFVLGLKILGLCRKSSWHIYVIYNTILYLFPHGLWCCGTLNTSFSHFYNRFSCKVFIPFDQILCKLKKKLMTIKIPKYFLPFEIFVMLPLWSRCLDNCYSFSTMSSTCYFYPVSFSSLSPITNIFLLCATQIPGIHLCSRNLLWKLS